MPTGLTGALLEGLPKVGTAGGVGVSLGDGDGAWAFTLLVEDGAMAPVALPGTLLGGLPDVGTGVGGGVTLGAGEGICVLALLVEDGVGAGACPAWPPSAAKPRATTQVKSTLTARTAR